MRVHVTGPPAPDPAAGIISRSFPATFAAATLFALRRMDTDDNRIVRTKSYIIDGSVLDIQCFFEYFFGKHTDSFT